MNNKYYLYILAFISGMTIMAMELAASRLLAPYFGTSIFVWTNIIGVVMIALSLGYWYGGKLADRKPYLKVLLKMILISGIIFILIPWIVKPIASYISVQMIMTDSATTVIFIGSLIVSTLLFAFPLFILGMTSPFLIKLFSLKTKEIGNVAGSVFALSTIGSIVGTFSVSLLFIPTIGTKYSISLFAIILIIFICVGLIKNRIMLVGVFLLLLPLILFLESEVKSDSGIIYEDESAYQYIQVKENGKGKRFLITNEGGGIQSVYDPNETITGEMYYDHYSLLPQMLSNNTKKNVLILGFAGGTIANQLEHFYGDEVNITGVELDKGIIDIADAYFATDKLKQTKIINQDGRIFINNLGEKVITNTANTNLNMNESKNRFDVVVVDVYQNQLYIPWTMTTEEFFTQVLHNLSTDGMVVININSTNLDSELLKSVTNTMAKVYAKTYLVQLDEEGGGWNYMVFGSVSEIDFENVSNLNRFEELNELADYISKNVTEFEYDSNRRVLTDDSAPVEFMTDKMIYNYAIK